MRILICDDDTGFSRQLREILITFFRENSLKLPEVIIYDSGEELLKDPGSKDIVFIEANNHKTIVHTVTDDHKCIRNIYYWLDQLQMPCFFQPHRSFIVNLDHVSSFDHSLIYLCNNQYRAYLTRRKYTQFKDAFLLSFINSVQINAIAFTLINFIILKLLCCAKWHMCFFHTLILSCFAGTGEIGSFAVFSQFKETGFYTDTHMLLIVIVTLLSKLLYFICVSVIRWRFASKDNFEYTGRVTALLNTIPLILIYIIVTLLAFILSTAPSATLRYMLSVSAFLLLIINFVIIYIYHYTQKKNAEFVELQLQLQKEYDMAQYYKTLFTQNKNPAISGDAFRFFRTAGFRPGL